MLYTLNQHNIICQLYLSKMGGVSVMQDEILEICCVT